MSAMVMLLASLTILRRCGGGRIVRLKFNRCKSRFLNLSLMKLEPMEPARRSAFRGRAPIGMMKNVANVGILPAVPIVFRKDGRFRPVANT
jgi:hypothetical protein